MKIICCSKDDILLEKLVGLYGAHSVLISAETRLLQENDLHSGEVLIVDLKYNKIPERDTNSLPVIALTSIPTFPDALLLLQSGVRGYGNRQMRQDNLGQAVDNVAAGQIWLPPSIISQLISTLGSPATDQFNNSLLETLTKREQEVARYVAEGMSNKEMADKMYVSLRTVKAHLGSIYDKTGLRNRLELGINLKKSAPVLEKV